MIKSEKPAKVSMRAPDGVESVSVGGSEIKVIEGYIKVFSEYVEALVSHGFHVIMVKIK